MHYKPKLFQDSPYCYCYFVAVVVAVVVVVVVVGESYGDGGVAAYKFVDVVYQ